MPATKMARKRTKRAPLSGNGGGVRGQNDRRVVRKRRRTRRRDDGAHSRKCHFEYNTVQNGWIALEFTLDV